MDILPQPPSLLFWRMVWVLCCVLWRRASGQLYLAIEAWCLPEALSVIPLAVLWLAWQHHWLTLWALRLVCWFSPWWDRPVGAQELCYLLVHMCWGSTEYYFRMRPPQIQTAVNYSLNYCLFINDWIFVFKRSLLTLIKNTAKCGHPLF